MDEKNRKAAALTELYSLYQNCTSCPLANLGRNKIVFGTGNPMSKIMLIGEGPGEKEDELGLPFVGRSGNLLTRMLAIAGINRQDIFITNIVKCRPPHNRKPTALESTTCKKILLEKQIEIINPDILCTLGSCPLESLLESKVSITKIRGQLLTWNNRHLIPTFHPAYILRNPVMLDYCIEDFLKLQEVVMQN